MSGYEEEHGIQDATERSSASRRRPDLSTFFSTLNLIDTSGASGDGRQNRHLEPLPLDVASAFRQLANSYQITLGETEGVTLDNGPLNAHASSNELLEGLIQVLMDSANDPPRRPHGMPEEFFDQLERIPVRQLKREDSCPICAIPFLEDKYPLIVRLPCHKDHAFDLECIRPWLKLQTTCPMCRQNLEKKELSPEPVGDEEEAWDEMYA